MPRRWPGGSAAAPALVVLSGALSSALGMVELSQLSSEGMNHTVLWRAEEALENPATDPGRLDILVYRNHYQQAAPDKVKTECQKTADAIKGAVEASATGLSVKPDCLSFSSPKSLKQVHAVKVTGLRKPFDCWKVIKELVTRLESVPLTGLSVVAPTYCTYKQDVKIPLWDVPYKVQSFPDMAKCMDGFGEAVVASTSSKAPHTLSTCDGTFHSTNFKEFALGAGKSMQSATQPDLAAIEAMAEQPPTDDETITSWEGSEQWRTTHFVKVYQLIQDFGAQEEEAATLRKSLVEGPIAHFQELNSKQVKEGTKSAYAYEVPECLPFAKGGVLYCTIMVTQGRGQGCLDLANYLVSKDSGGITQFNVGIPSQCQYEDDLSKRLSGTNLKYTDKGPFEDMKSCQIRFRDEITSFTNTPQLLGLCDGKAFEGPGFRHWVGVSVLDHGKSTENAEDALKKQQALDKMVAFCKDSDPKVDKCKADQCAKSADWIATTKANLKDTPLQMIIDRLAHLKMIILKCNQATTSLQKFCGNSAVNPCTADSCKAAMQWLDSTKDLEETQIQAKLKELTEKTAKCNEAMDLFFELCREDEADKCKSELCKEASTWLMGQKDIVAKTIRDKVSELKKAMDDKCTVVDVGPDKDDPTIKFAKDDIGKLCGENMQKCALELCQEAQTWVAQAENGKKAIQLEEIAARVKAIKAVTDGCKKGMEDIRKFCDVTPNDEPCKFKICKETLDSLEADEALTAEKVVAALTKVKTETSKCKKIVDPKVEEEKKNLDDLCTEDNRYGKCGSDLCKKALEWTDAVGEDIKFEDITRYLKEINAATEECDKSLDDVKALCSKGSNCPALNCEDVLKGLLRDKELTSHKIKKALILLQFKYDSECKKGGGESPDIPKKDDDDATGPKKDDDDTKGPKKDDDDTKGPKKEDDDAKGPKKDDDDATGPKKDDDDTKGPKKDDDDTKGPKKDDDDATGPKKDDDDTKGPKKDDDDTKGPKKDDDDTKGPKKDDDDTKGPKTDDDDTKGPKKDDDDIKGPKKDDDDTKGPKDDDNTEGPKKDDDDTKGPKKEDDDENKGPKTEDDKELVWVMTTPGSLTYQEPSAESSPGGFTKFSVGRAGMVWAIDKAGHIWMCSDACKSGGWKEVDLPSGDKAVSIGAGLWEVWMADASDVLWMRPVDGYGAWTRMYGASATSVDLTTTAVYAVDGDHGVFRCELPCLTLEGEGVSSYSPWKSMSDKEAAEVVASGDKVLLKTPSSKWLDVSTDKSDPVEEASDTVLIDNKGKVVNVAKGTTVVLTDLDWASDTPNRNSCLHSEKCWGITPSNSVAVDLPPDARWVAGTGGLKFISVGRSWAYGFNADGAIFKRPYPSSDSDHWTLVSKTPVPTDIVVVPLADEEVWMVSDPPTPGKESVKIMRSNCGDENTLTDQDYLFTGLAKDGSSIYKGRRQTQFNLFFSSACSGGGAWIVTTSEPDPAAESQACDEASIKLKFSAANSPEDSSPSSKLRPPFGSSVEVERKSCPSSSEKKEGDEESGEAAGPSTMAVRLQESSLVYRQFAGSSTWTDTLVFLNEIDGGKEYIGGTVSFNKWNYCVLWQVSGPFKWVQVSKDENIEHVGVGNEYMFGLSADGSKFYRRKVAAGASGGWEDLSELAPPEKLDVLMVSGEKDTLWGVDGQGQVWKSNPVSVAWTKATELTAEELKFTSSASLVQLEEHLGHQSRSLPQIPSLETLELDERATSVEISAEGSVHKAEPIRPRAHYRNKRRQDPGKVMHVDSA